MGRTSLPEVSAKFVADVEGMLSNLKRAENATRSTASNIDREVGTLTKKLGDKFKLADFGKDVLKGAGLFGGFDIARTAAEAIAGFWERAAESAKVIEESTAKSLEATMKTIAARQTEDQKNQTALNTFNSAEKKLREAKEQKMQSVPLYRLGVQVGVQQVPRVHTDAEKEEIQRLTDQYNALGSQVEEFQRKQRDTTAAEEAAASMEAISLSGDRVTRQLAAMAGAQQVANQRFKEATEILSESQPLKKFEDQLERINFLIQQGSVTFDEAWKSKVKIWSDMADEVERLHPQKTSTHAEMKDIGADQIRAADELMRKMDFNAQEMERIVGRAADGMADAWVDSLKGVEGAWGNLADTIITEIMRVAAQILIVKPMINGLGSMLSGLGGGDGFLGTLGAAFSSYGGAKASGGGVGAGYTYRVNENGQEYFKPNVGGTIIPVGASANMRGSEGGRGDSYAFHYNFASGIQRQDILPILNIWQRETLAKIADAKRRRTSLGVALA